MRAGKLMTIGGSIAVSLLVAHGAVAQLDSDAQKCIDGYNNKLRLVSQQAGKSARKCIKNATKGKEPAPDTCIVSNTDGKIAGKEAKVDELYSGGKCNGSEPIQQGAAIGNAAHRDGITDLMHALFGDPVPAPSTDKADAKCLDKGVQRATQAVTEIIKAHRKCKKDAMKVGTVVDSATLDATCGTFAQIDTAGKNKPTAKLAKITADVGDKCGEATSSLGALFPGLEAGCTADAAALSACLVAASRCTACTILNTADGQGMDCDAFDDGTANSSCAGGAPGVDLGSHVCTLGAGSALNLGTQALPLNLSPTGSIQITCGTTAPNGTASCTCDVNSFGVLVIPSIGDVCVNPYSGCQPGRIDCDGGSPLDVDLVADHNIGACSSDSGCAADCDAECGGLGANYDAIAYGCEGFCQGGSNDNNACARDTDCPGGQCPGADPVSHGGVCQCTCAGRNLGAAGPAGSLSCEVGVQIDVELPSDGDCADPNTIQLAPICGGVTTTTATGMINNANNTSDKTIPPIGGSGTAPATATGAGISCAALASSTTTGLNAVGFLGFFDSVLGDIFSANRFVCQ